MSEQLDLVLKDLAASGLVIEDIQARLLESSERAATNVPYSVQGYAIPYFDMYGRSVPHYRVKLFDFEPKYKQPKDSVHHVYFPKGFHEALEKHSYILVTEGEKKAVLATKRGFPTVALGGVDSWRNRIITFPVSAEMQSTDKTIRAKLPAGYEYNEDFLSPLAIGLQDIIDIAVAKGKHIILLYDSDAKAVTTYNVQRAAAALAYELRFRGVPYNQIRQIRLPVDGTRKFALDDFIIEQGNEALQTLVTSCLAKRSAFPRHPNTRDFVNKRLQAPRLTRKEIQQISMSILCELDAGGLRLRSTQESRTYYFDQSTHKLLPATFASESFTENAFGHFLYSKFGIGSADDRLIQWLGTHFTGEDPVADVSPYRVFARLPYTAVTDTHHDEVIYQVTDGQYVRLTGDTTSGTNGTPGLSVHNNGEANILFEAEQVAGLNIEKLLAEYKRQYDLPLNSWWMDVLSQVRLKDQNKQRALTALLFYTSPWLYRWRGTQLPLEMTLGEAGSGKSTLQSLRLNILTGTSKLRNAPQDMKDWTASVTSTGGLHIIDNLALPDRNMRQRLSDEICRVITEADPSIEQRQYYTNAKLVQYPVRCVFGITAIRQPFLNSDVLARSVLIELDKGADLMTGGQLIYDNTWENTQLQRFGGREAWAAHHLLVLHRFFQLAKKKWNMKYQAKHRLINLEQNLCLMAEVFGMDPSWIPAYLQGSTNLAIVDVDWAFEGLKVFAEQRRYANNRQPFGAQEISNWAQGMDEYEKCEELTNSRRIGRYLLSHKALIAQVVGIIEVGTQNNRKVYNLAEKK